MLKELEIGLEWFRTTQLWRRVKSLLWRALMMGLATLVTYIVENLSVLELSPQVTVVLGLVLGEVSKWLNTRR